MAKDELEARVDRIEECLEAAGYPVKTKTKKEKPAKPAAGEGGAGEGGGE